MVVMHLICRLFQIQQAGAGTSLHFATAVPVNHGPLTGRVHHSLTPSIIERADEVMAQPPLNGHCFWAPSAAMLSTCRGDLFLNALPPPLHLQSPVVISLWAEKE